MRALPAALAPRSSLSGREKDDGVTAGVPDPADVLDLRAAGVPRAGRPGSVNGACAAGGNVTRPRAAAALDLPAARSPRSRRIGSVNGDGTGGGTTACPAADDVLDLRAAC